LINSYERDAVTSTDDLNVIVAQVEMTGVWDVSCFNPICGEGLHGVGEDPSKGKAEAMARRHRLEIGRKQARRDAAQGARNTNTAADIIREALRFGHRHSAEAGMRVLYNLAAAVKDTNLLDGLGLPATNPWSESDHEPDDGACSECGLIKDDIWPILGRPGYFCQGCCIKLTGADPAQPA
jgi:hypothetical protein